MIKLTDTQMSVLASACERTDGIAVRPNALNRTAAVKVAAKLLDRGLVREVAAKAGWPVWRKDEEGRGFSLKILQTGRALAQSQARLNARVNEQCAARADAKASPTYASTIADGQALPSGSSSQESVPVRKRDLVTALLQRERGASIVELMAATGWLPHSTRAALTGPRKAGLSIERSRDVDGQASVYRIALPAAAPAATA